MDNFKISTNADHADLTLKNQKLENELKELSQKKDESERSFTQKIDEQKQKIISLNKAKENLEKSANADRAELILKNLILDNAFQYLSRKTNNSESSLIQKIFEQEKEITSLNEEMDNFKISTNADHADLTLKNQKMENELKELSQKKDESERSFTKKIDEQKQKIISLNKAKENLKEDWEKCRTDKGNVATSLSAQTSTQTSLSTYVNPVSLPSTDNKYDIPSMFQHFADKMKGAANPEVMDKTLIEDFSREVTVHNNIKKLKNYTITMTLSLHEKIITEETVITEAAPEIGSPRVVGSNPPDPTKPLQRNNIPIGTESSVDPHSNAHDVDGVVTIDIKDPEIQQKIIDNLTLQKINLENKLKELSQKKDESE
ncbi:hypothetical protein DAPPUDRAFT_124023, partial [Daphnia pulex]